MIGFGVDRDRPGRCRQRLVGWSVLAGIDECPRPLDAGEAFAAPAFNNLLIHRVQIVTPLAATPSKTVALTADKAIRREMATNRRIGCFAVPNNARQIRSARGKIHKGLHPVFCKILMLLNFRLDLVVLTGIAAKARHSECDRHPTIAFVRSNPATQRNLFPL